MKSSKFLIDTLIILLVLYLISFGFFVSTKKVHADEGPIKIQYSYQGELWTGWLGYINYPSKNNIIETGEGFGFYKETEPYPIETTEFLTVVSDVTGNTFLFASATSLKYNDSFMSSRTFRVKQLGWRLVNETFIPYFDLE